MIVALQNQASIAFTCYGIKLRRIASDDLQQVWNWRNCLFVREKMQYQQEISWESHQNWYRQLSLKNDWYFIGYENESPLGVFHVKQIDWQCKVGEAGAFVAKPELIGKPESGLAILALMDFAFLYLKLEKLEAKYNLKYENIVSLNKQLGYETFANYDDGFVRATVSKKRYFEKAKKLRDAASILSGGEPQLITT